MATPNLTCRWDELQVGDQVLTKDDVIAFTIDYGPFVNDGRVGYRVRGTEAKVVEHGNRAASVRVRRPSL